MLGQYTGFYGIYDGYKVKQWVSKNYGSANNVLLYEHSFNKRKEKTLLPPYKSSKEYDPQRAKLFVSVETWHIESTTFCRFNSSMK